MHKTVEKIKSTWAFALAAASVPLSYILLFPCLGGGCAGCPTGGACLLSVPFLIALVIVGKSFLKIKKAIGKLADKVRSR
jgi:SNF family Na+-dependent transporter